jgi:hypothetical protein
LLQGKEEEGKKSHVVCEPAMYLKIKDIKW